MTTFEEWAAKWPDAYRELVQITAPICDPTVYRGRNMTDEGAVQNAIRVEAAKTGRYLLWRNNVGALLDDRGVPVRYGLANDTKALNDVFKSSDLIGIRKLIITPEHVGSVVGQFVARECKRADWKFSGSKREIAQLNYLTKVKEWGGDASFAHGPGSFGA